jgi:hypothetical protein
MKRFLPTFLLITLVLAIYPFIGMDEKKSSGVTGLPWQIEILPDGSSKVFGLVPGRSTLAEAAEQLGDDMELAVMVARGETTGNLEMYYGQYRAGLLSAKLVLAAELDAATIQSMIENAADKEVLKTGAHKYVLNEQDYPRAFNAVIETIACVPAVNLDHDIIIKRFGEPAEVIQKQNQVIHYLYPEKGLDVILSEEGKEVLQYVAPARFERLRAPLGQA